jgi:hypothetical protein
VREEVLSQELARVLDPGLVGDADSLAASRNHLQCPQLILHCVFLALKTGDQLSFVDRVFGLEHDSLEHLLAVFAAQSQKEEAE